MAVLHGFPHLIAAESRDFPTNHAFEQTIGIARSLEICVHRCTRTDSSLLHGCVDRIVKITHVEDALSRWRLLIHHLAMLQRHVKEARVASTVGFVKKQRLDNAWPRLVTGDAADESLKSSFEEIRLLMPTTSSEKLDVRVKKCRQKSSRRPFTEFQIPNLFMKRSVRLWDRLSFSLATDKTQFLVDPVGSAVRVDRWALLRATKHYRMTSMGEEGDLYTRDLKEFNEYLRGLFDEVHIWCSSFRDITVSLARRRIREKRFSRLDGGDGHSVDPDELSARYQDLAEGFAAVQAEQQRYEGLRRLARGRSSLVDRLLQDQIGRTRGQLDQTRIGAKPIREKLATQQHLERQYMSKSEATCLLFTCCSNIHAVDGPEEFARALRSVVKEICDVHHYQLKPKLGSKLRIYVEEVSAPGVALLTRWAGAALCPRQLERLGPEFEDLRNQVEDQCMVFPWNDVVLGGAVQDERKLVAARVVRSFLE